MRGQFFGDLLIVFVLPLVMLVLGAFVLAVVLAQGWGLHTIFGHGGGLY
jgi:hypothetical protein